LSTLPTARRDPNAIGADLRRLVRGEVAFDEATRALYSTAACIYRIQPLGVVAPLDADDAAAAVSYCRAHGIPLTPRGGGSGLAGQALGDGIVLDFTPHMNRILEVTNDHAWVQPGLILDQLNAVLAPLRRWFPPDPSSSGYCSLGGMIANNSAGSHSVKYGTTIDYVEELDVLLSDGARAHVMPYELDGAAWRRLVAEETREAQVHRDLRMLVERHADLIRSHQPRTAKNSAGYRLERVIEGGTLNLSKLICGSEGTLAIVLAAKLRTAPLPGARRVAVLHFPDLASAGRAVLEILQMDPSAIEIDEHRTIEVIRAGCPGLAGHLPGPGQSQLFVEFDGPTEDNVAPRLTQMRERICRDLALATRCIEPTAPEEVRKLWAMRKATLPLLYNRPGPKRIISFIEDVTVPVAQIPTYIEGLHGIFERHGVEAAVYGHASQGNFHVRPFLDLHDPAEVAKMQAIADEVFGLTISLGGTTSGEHGDGIARTQYLEKLYGPLVPLFGAVKRIFDPDNLLNPGKKVADRCRDYALASHLRFDPGYGSRPMGERLAWGELGLAAEAERCHGCGTCRSLPAAQTRMCPVFNAIGLEEASPRAKANLLREIAAGRLAGQAALSGLERVSDHCILCGSCKADCPSKLDVPKLMLEAKARVAADGKRTLWRSFFVRLEDLSRFAAPLAPVVNATNRFPPARWLLEKLFHVARRRPLPRLTRRPLHKRLRKKGTGTFSAEGSDAAVRLTGLTRGEKHGTGTFSPAPRKNVPVPFFRQVAYFPDVFAEYNDPSIGEALVRLLEAAGIAVIVPRVKGCGILAICYGDVVRALKTIRHNLAQLRDHARQGLDILVTEPTALLCLRESYGDFVADEAARDVAARSHDAVEYLLALRRSGRLPVELREVPMTLGYHTPCHSRAAGLGAAAPTLLGEIPGLKVIPVNEGCCGIAGSAGLRREKYELSMQIGAKLFERLRSAEFDGAATECSACRMQLEHATGKPVYHPLHLLAHAAFGMPLPKPCAAPSRR
jgi:FAD/FMN-containing dehydrogenase/Fe-S oxidoreductase